MTDSLKYGWLTSLPMKVGGVVLDDRLENGSWYQCFDWRHLSV